MANSKTFGGIIAAAALPVLLIYIMIGKPDYKLANSTAHIVIPIAHNIGSAITWPIRAIKNGIANVYEISSIRSENSELRALLDAALRDKGECDIFRAENKRILTQLDMLNSMPQKTVLANVILENSALGHSGFMISKGTENGVMVGNAVISNDGYLVGIVSDASETSARVRSLWDSKSNIPVKIAGSDVYGFLRGNGAGLPSIGFFSDPEFMPTPGLHLTTSGVRGTLPNGVMVGNLITKNGADVKKPSELSEVVVLSFDKDNRY